MPSNQDSDTTTLAVLGTEEILTTVTTAGDYQFVLNSKNLVDDEEIVIRIFARVLTGAIVEADDLTDLGGTINARSPKFNFSIPASIVFAIRVKATQNNGTLRAFDWALIKMGG